MVKKILSILSFAFLMSCSPTNMLTLGVTQPAPVYISKEVKNIGIINRTTPDKTYNAIDAIDKILTLEGKELDKLCAQNAIASLKENLEKNESLTNVVVIDTTIYKKYGIDLFAPELAWKDIDKLCKAYKVDAIYELSFFDTDAKVNYRTINQQKTTPIGLKIPYIEHEVNVNTIVKTGWRIYDNVDKRIADVYPTTENINLGGRGINPTVAFEAIMGRKDAVMDVARRNAQNYTYRILPYNIRVSREYYVKGCSNFEIAKRRAQTGDWDGAAQLWEKELNNSNPKVAGRAAYNMAIINEINGNLDKAVEWSSKTYADYGDKLALRYLNILKNRIQNEKALNQ